MKPKIYMAGKIGKHDWRHTVLGTTRIDEGWNNYMPGHNTWVEHADLIYVGPFFMSCDHGCFHDIALHGATRTSRFPPGKHDGLGCVESLSEEAPSPNSVYQRAIQGILDCDIFFCYVEKMDAIGSLFELGYAAANNKHVVLCTSGKLKRDQREFWFAARGADSVYADVSLEGPNSLNQILEDEIAKFKSLKGIRK